MGIYRGIYKEWASAVSWHSRRCHKKLIILLMTTLASACSDLPESVGSDGSGNHSGQGMEQSVDEEEGRDGPPNTLEVSSAFPDDTDDDDREGLLVTGLDGLSAADVVSPWLAVARSFRSVSDPNQMGDGEVELVRYADDFPVAAHMDYLAWPLDTCQIRQLDADGEAEDDNPPPSAISGGQSIIFNTASGPWFTFDLTHSADDAFVYQAAGQLPGAFPQGVSLSIPGSSFPTVAAHPLYQPSAVERILPDAAQAASSESRLQWVAGQQNTAIKIDWLAFDDRGEFVSFPVSCLARDDGEFLPDAVTRAVLAGSTHRLELRYSRVYARLDVYNGIVFYQEAEVAE